MLRVINIFMVILPELKLDVVLRAIEAFLIMTNHFENFVTRLHYNYEARTSQFVPSVVPQVFPSESEYTFQKVLYALKSKLDIIFQLPDILDSTRH